VGQERLGPSYFLIPLVLGPRNSLVWYVPSLRYTRGLGWRMHCGVEVTELSTNKQHHISQKNKVPQCLDFLSRKPLSAAVNGHQQPYVNRRTRHRTQYNCGHTSGLTNSAPPPPLSNCVHLPCPCSPRFYLYLSRSIIYLPRSIGGICNIRCTSASSSRPTLCVCMKKVVSAPADISFFF
jgi:hypothetical protein